jgi:hypothetical protein
MVFIRKLFLLAIFWRCRHIFSSIFSVAAVVFLEKLLSKLSTYVVLHFELRRTGNANKINESGVEEREYSGAA